MPNIGSHCASPAETTTGKPIGHPRRTRLACKRRNYEPANRITKSSSVIASLWIAPGVALRLAPQFYPAPTGRPRGSPLSRDLQRSGEDVEVPLAAHLDSRQHKRRVSEVRLGGTRREADVV